MDKDVFALDEKIGRVKEIGIDPEEWKITHLEIELEKDIADSVLGAKKGGGELKKAGIKAGEEVKQAGKKSADDVKKVGHETKEKLRPKKS